MISSTLQRQLQRVKIKWLVRQGKPIPFQFRGTQYVVNPDDSAAYHIHNSTDKIAKLADLVGHDAEVVFDVGANCGLFSAFASARLPKCTFHIFEPAPELLPYLETNCGGGNLHIHPIAVSDVVGQVDFFVNPSSQQTNSLSANAVELFVTPETRGAGMNCLRVDCISLDRFCEDNGITQIDVLKIDVQGAEGGVLRGSSSILEHVNALFIESTWIDIESILNLVPFARERGFLYLSVLSPVYMGADILLTRSMLDSELVINQFRLDDYKENSWL